MGLIPSTGSEISMGKIAKALGITTAYPPGPSEGNIKLADTLGTGRARATTVISSFASGSQVREGTDFGGLTTPNDY